MAEGTCYSGGAIGADACFGLHAEAVGHRVIHWTFAAHVGKCEVSRSLLHVLPEEDLHLADPHVARANQSLGRTWPPSSDFTANLLRRNWYQVADAERCYAVSKLDRHGRVDGGTAWAVQMFIDCHNGQPCPCYVFCQTREQWFGWTGSWEASNPPRPEGRYAGIGSRKLLANGANAIAMLYA